jgi:hypothetical protein
LYTCYNLSNRASEISLVPAPDTRKLIVFIGEIRSLNATSGFQLRASGFKLMVSLGKRFSACTCPNVIASSGVLA